MNMLRALLLAGFTWMLSSAPASGFTFLGPFKSWMTPDVGYRWNGQIGGPVLPSEGFRWNAPVIYYAYDRSFIEYFGAEGVAAVEEAIKVINDLPSATEMTPDLREFPLNTRKVNYAAQTIGLVDVKSRILGLLLEQMGLTSPEQFVWTLRGREVLNAITNYSVFKMNYDPVTFRPSSYVNGALYTYEIYDLQTRAGGVAALAAETRVADLRTRAFSSVAGSVASGLDVVYSSDQDPATGFTFFSDGDVYPGDYFIGITRDDAGGLRRLYTPNSTAVENLPPDVLPSGGGNGTGGPWGTGGGVNTNVITTNAIPPALRTGINKVRFQRVQYDSLVGLTFTPFQATYSDSYIQGGQARSRSVTRLVVRPDLLFSARDIGTTFGLPFQLSRTTAETWQSNSGLNTHDPSFNIVVGGGSGGPQAIIQDTGPGVIQAPGAFSINISLTSLYPAYYNLNPGFITEQSAGSPIAWGSFDGSTNPPTVYPRFGGVSLALLNQLSAGVNSGSSSPWNSSFSLLLASNLTGAVTAGATP